MTRKTWLFLILPVAVIIGHHLQSLAEENTVKPVLASTVSPVDFGLIEETEGSKTVRFYVKNISDSVVSILKVRPTCGCTAADFQKEPVLPGDSAWIDLIYDPVRRPGKFEKGVRVYPVYGDMIRIPITGVVAASPATLEYFFPVEAGQVNISTNTLLTLSPLDSRERSLFLDVYNNGDKPVWIKLISDNNAVVTQEFPDYLPPKEQGSIGVFLNPTKEPRSGHLEYSLLLYSFSDPLTLEESEPFEIKLITEK